MAMADDIFDFSAFFAKCIRTCFSNVPYMRNARDTTPRPHELGSLSGLIDYVLRTRFRGLDELSHAYTALYLLRRLARNSDHYIESRPERNPWKAGHWGLLFDANRNHLLAIVLLIQSFTTFDRKKENPNDLVEEDFHPWARIMLRWAYGPNDHRALDDASPLFKELVADLFDGWDGARRRLSRGKKGTYIDPIELEQFRARNPPSLSTIAWSNPASLHIAHHRDQVEQTSNSRLIHMGPTIGQYTAPMSDPVFDRHHSSSSAPASSSAQLDPVQTTSSSLDLHDLTPPTTPTSPSSSDSLPSPGSDLNFPFPPLERSRDY